MNDLLRRLRAPDVRCRGAGLGQPGFRLAAAILAVVLLGSGASAADPGWRVSSEAWREDGWSRPASPPRRVEPAGRPVLAARRSALSFFGRDCLPGFALNVAGICVRHDDPRLACGGVVSGCVVLPPDPAPYGLGAALRLDY